MSSSNGHGKQERQQSRHKGDCAYGFSFASLQRYHTQSDIYHQCNQFYRKPILLQWILVGHNTQNNGAEQ